VKASGKPKAVQPLLLSYQNMQTINNWLQAGMGTVLLPAKRTKELQAKEPSPYLLVSARRKPKTRF